MNLTNDLRRQSNYGDGTVMEVLAARMDVLPVATVAAVASAVLMKPRLCMPEF